MTTALDTGQSLDTGQTLDWSALAPAYQLGDSHWQMWGMGLLRSAGFPVSGLKLLGGPRAARAAALADGGDTAHEAFRAAYRADTETESVRLARLATDDRVRTAIAWQNRTVYRILDSLAARKGKESKRRQRERTLAMYWLRYCAKADTIGFFGPGAWISVGQGQRALALDHGPSLTAASRTFFERWTMAALADRMAARPGARWWFPPMLRPDVHLDGDRLVMQGGRTVRLREDDVHVLRLADGDRSAEAIADATGWDPATARQRVEKVLTRLLKQRVLTWDANIPVDVRAEEVLRRRVAGIGDPELFVHCAAILAELDRLRVDIDRADSAEELVAALDRLDDFFVRTTGQAASREEGKAYAGRTLCYQDSLRDCRTDLGRDFVDSIARPLALVADTADWFGNRLAELAEAEVAGFVRKAAARRADVTLADVWTQVLGLFWGDRATPVHTATRELAEKWREVLALDPAAPGSVPVRLSVADIEERARAVFATGPVRSPHLAVHSPDLQVVASSPEAVNAGEYTAVLGELHACLATLDLPFLDWTCDTGSLRDQVNAALDAPRMVPLLPVEWKRNSGRMVPAPIGAGDRLIGFTRAPYDDRGRVDPAAAIALAETDGTVTATTPDGRTWSMAELLAVPVSIIAADAFKIGLDRAHAPRVTLDDLVLFRETWRLPVAGVALPDKADKERDYLAVRRWVNAHALPDLLFVKFPEETKPSLVDFTSPTLVLAFASLVRAARRLDPDAAVTLSEPLPAPDDSWLTDADGERYVSELRLQISRKVPE
ncbi:lantibiotic dehydratase family protein [Streptomyces sp. RY43-2]|uniref:Lantibiotic dehydratase family protein n=1 Tax=Streptomyces macrolidinus TaxID=2952607 RepID=A0ABT0ZHJ4_9ACTN|nr:lantibiotic dehydratase [Streptomyces macrolidinus]MCN9243058.1 lantibiotic dehydratase family protein [Streptomyces macrolidinus]